MSRILVDAYKIKNLNSGLGQFSFQFITNLFKHSSPDLDISCLAPSDKSILFENKLSFVKANLMNRHFRNSTKYDLWHSLHQFPAHLPNSNSKQILTIHDLNFLVEKEGNKRARYLKLMQKRVDNAHVITTISKFSKIEIEKNINLKGKNIKVIYNGVEIQNNLPEVTPNALKKEAFLFSIGIFNKKKNFHSLLHMMRNLHNYKLVIAGNNATSYGNEIKLLINEFSLQEKVILVGTITENEKSWYYKNCKALLFPSTAEGFGIPPIEAMMYGKPVFMSKLTSLPEIGGNVAFYFENFESDSMAKQIELGLTIAEIDPNFSSKSISYAAKFSWDTCIQKYLEVYRETINI